MKTVIEKLEELKLEAWGYEHTFESSFHAEVFYKLEEIIEDMKEQNHDIPK